MREILFRGKRAYNGEWVYGFYLYTDENTHHVIIDMKCCSHIIIPETVGQYTGLTDRNGKKIFEGDIVDEKGNNRYVGVAANRVGIFKVIFYESMGCFAKYKITDKESEKGTYLFISSDDNEIIGNVFDNPELIEGE